MPARFNSKYSRGVFELAFIQAKLTEVVPEAAPPRSNTCTSAPLRESRKATEAPTIPAPMTATRTATTR